MECGGSTPPSTARLDAPPESAVMGSSKSYLRLLSRFAARNKAMQFLKMPWSRSVDHFHRFETAQIRKTAFVELPA
jgi:hypothetical protein